MVTHTMGWLSARDSDLRTGKVDVRYEMVPLCYLEGRGLLSLYIVLLKIGFYVVPSSFSL
jgi:hypothetical protein